MNNNQNQKTISEKEQETLSFWLENKIFQKSIETPAGSVPKGDFSFYDGPPFATGLPHYGHILAGTIKDAIPRYQTMKGNAVRRVWGWDCHGLPIENLIEKKLGLKSKKDIEDFGIGKFNKDANDSVLKYEEEWKSIIPRLGRWVDMKHAYKTMDATYTESVWWAWKSLSEKGLAYEGNKMMHICPRCETTLAQSEVGMNYEDITDLSLTAKFELTDELGTFVLAWTTTPWTLPGNTALALKKDAEYVKVEIDGVSGKYILAKERVEDALKDMKVKELETFLGETLVGKSYKPVFPYFKDIEMDNKENIWKIWHADFITLDTGTGIAHEAPAFGADDMELAKQNKIPIIKHIKMDGTFTKDVVDFVGMKVKTAEDNQKADVEIIKYLAHAGLLFEKHKIVHSYPLCWRCKTPLLNYATSSWFIDVPKIKEKLISENKKIGWTPAHTRDGRFGKWLEGAREWAVSRTRYWGAPLPVWKNEDGEMIMIGSLKELAEKNKQKPKNNYYVVRHGEANSNVEDIFDCKDAETNHLTEKGKGQVLDLIKDLKGLNIDLIVSSPFLRTRETSQIISEMLGVKVITDERLREGDVGIYNGWKIKDYLEKHANGTFLKLDFRPEGGETHQEIQNRMMSAVCEYEKKLQGKNILFVSHGGPCRMVIAGANLATEEEIIADEMKEHTELYIKNGEFKKLDLLLVPRDETGAVNLHRPYIDEIELEVGGKTYKRIPDVFDCWYESGAMPFASVHYPFENKEVFEKNFPADFIAEGMDQTRGWFYSLINLGVGLFDKAPYKHVIVSGLVLAGSGSKLSKSERNYTDPMELVEKYGADAMRYVLLSGPLMKGENMQFDDENVAEVYKKIVVRLENVVQLYEMNVSSKVLPKNTSKNVLDMWMISRIHELVKSSTAGYENYMLDDATKGITDLVDDLSVWYTRRSRERLKGDMGEKEQTEAGETLNYVLVTLSKVMAPVMPFIAERIYKSMGGEKESVHLESWPSSGDIDEKVLQEMKDVREVVSLGLMERTKAKINVKQPLLSLTTKKEIPEIYFDLIRDEVNIKKIVVDNSQVGEVVLDTTITEELKKEGDVRKLMRAIQDARKEKGLNPKDIVSVAISDMSLLGDVAQLKNTCKISEIKEDKSINDNPVELSSGTLYFTVN
jgi:isoleucyl-tRNA synthetase